MTPERYQLVKRIFTDVCKSDPHDRIAVLERECGNDLELRTEVEALLSRDENAADFLSKPPMLDPEQIWQAAQQTNGAARRPERIGQYRICDVLGEGGMGVVYLAEQENPRRPVALKVIRPGITSEPMLRRFEFEAQMLGRLNHPGIAAIYEAGTADTGFGPQPYFAMELVQGPSLRDYADHRQLTIRQRLELLVKICDAVHHAHQKGIIHRDLKPANILVEDSGEVHGLQSVGFNAGSAQPKILDFGIARAIDRDEMSKTMRTSAGQIVGTIAYMSPEQLAGDPQDVDIRADVYSLGVIYYELLSGRPPHDLTGKRLPESIRTVMEQPIKPLGAINKMLRGDLATIVDKALEKDRARRYQSALELAEDTRRFLNHQPIAARPPSTLYHLRKFATRKPAMVVSAALAAVLIVTTPIAYTMRQAARVESMVLAEALLRDMGDPLKPGIEDMATLQKMASAASDAERQNPVVAASIRSALGLNYMKLAAYPQAREQLSRALQIRAGLFSPPHSDLADSHYNMSRLLWYEGRYDDAVAQAKIALEMQRELLNYGLPDQGVAQTMDQLASCYRKLGQRVPAEQYARDALEIRRRIFGDQHWLVAASMTNLAMILGDQDRYNEAAILFEQAMLLVLGQAQEPDEDRRVAGAMTSLADCLIHLRQFDQAEQLAQRALEIKRRAYAAQHPSTATTLVVLAKLRHEQGKQHEALALCREALAMQESTQPPGHIDIATTCSILGQTLLTQAKPTQAEPHLRRALRIRQDQFPATHHQIAESQGLLGECLMRLESSDEAERLLLASHETSLASRGPSHRQTQIAAQRLASLYEIIGDAEKAQRYRTEDQ